MNEILSIQNLSKNYGKIKAVDDLSFTVEKGTVYGILGPNGSGKTTTLSVITGVLHPASGSYRWFGNKPGKWERKRIGSLIEIPNFYPYLTLFQNLQIVARIKNVPEEDINRVLGITDILKRKYSRFDTLSLGMKQRLSFASVLLGDPEVLVLDEPANGLDPEGIAEVRKIIISERDKGKTIIIASHILDEVEKVCTHVGILKMGKLIASGLVDKLLVMDSVVTVSAPDNTKLKEILEKSGLVKNIKEDIDSITATILSETEPGEINKYVIGKGITLTRLEVNKPTLESQFLELVREQN
ncbi:MAG: ABC transporter ATP-binding protein [Bacteroidetes bacterium]|nr:ABC transporter ATP-binding protein [Bacteroidota bacterium]